MKYQAKGFKHKANLRNDPTIIKLRDKYGNKGWGVVCFCHEIMAEDDLLSLEWNDAQIHKYAADFQISGQSLCEIIDYCIELQIFKLHNGRLSSIFVTEDVIVYG